MHQCRDALLWCIITVMHHRYNASTLWCIKNRMCQCDLLYILFYWYDVLRCSVMNGWCMVWCVEMQCDEWVMHSMMQCVLNGWCMGDALVVWCVMWMNEWMNVWMNEWWIIERVGNVEWLCILLYFICICNMSLYLFRAFYIRRINPNIHPRTSVCHLSHEPDLQHRFKNFRHITLMQITDVIIWTASSSKHIEVETRCPPFRRRHFQTLFLEWKCINCE